MKWYLLFFVVLAITCMFYYKPVEIFNMKKDNITTQITESMTLYSSVFYNNQNIPEKYTCKGLNINPPFEISGVPALTKSLVLIMEDPDAPAGTWNHWVKFNISPTTKEIKEGDENFGTSGKGTAGNDKYFGPCPPSGLHHYIFTLYAVDTTLTIDEGATKERVLSAIEGHIIQQTTLTGLFSRK